MERNDPVSNFKFVIEIDSDFAGGFNKASGIGSEIEFEEYREGGNNFNYKFPVKIKHHNIILEKGVTKSQFMYQWFSEMKNGIVKKRNFAISVLDSNSNKIRTWNFKNGYPVKWEISDLNATDKSVLIEKIELSHEGIEE